MEFGFDNAFKTPKENDPINLHAIFIFGNGDYKSFYKNDKNFDSAFNSPVPLNNLK